MSHADPQGHAYTNAVRRLHSMMAQRRRLRLALRALWIAGLLAAILLAARRFGGVALPTWLIWGVPLVALGAGLAWAWRARQAPFAVINALDSAFNLDNQLGTALEVNARGLETPFGATLTAQARRRLALLAPDVLARTASPLYVEGQALACVALLLAGLLLLPGTGPQLPTAQPADLPSLDSPAAGAIPPQEIADNPEGGLNPEGAGGERPANNPTQPGEGAGPLEGESQAAAEAIADALRDNGATREAADALDRGDTAGAAESLRELADQADGLSDQARQDIADALDQAASELGEQPAQQDQLRRSADQLRQDGESAAQGLDDLARQIENLRGGEGPGQPQANDPLTPSEQGQAGEGGEGGEGQPGAGQEPGAGDGTGQNSANQGITSPPSSGTGQDVPLPEPPSLEGPSVPATGAGETVILPGGEGESSGGSGGSGGSVPADISDPAAIPPSLRNAIQDYFTR